MPEAVLDAADALLQRVGVRRHRDSRQFAAQPLGKQLQGVSTLCRYSACRGEVGQQGENIGTALVPGGLLVFDQAQSQPQQWQQDCAPVVIGLILVLIRVRLPRDRPGLGLEALHDAPQRLFR